MTLLIAQLVSERDQATRGAALSALEAAYSQLGPDLWPLLGHLTDQQRSLIEERLKFSERAAAAAERLLPADPPAALRYQCLFILASHRLC